MWRPDIVVTQHGASENADPMSALAEQLVLQAVIAAADPAQYPDISADIGLAPGKSKKSTVSCHLARVVTKSSPPPDSRPGSAPR